MSHFKKCATVLKMKSIDFFYRTKDICEKTCHSSDVKPDVSTTQSAPVDTCQQPLVTGPCRGAIPKWGSKDGECVQFTYGGCGGNDNNFRWVSINVILYSI